MANEVTDRITVGVPWSEEAGGGGGIQEVNGYTGPSVVLDAADVGALPDDRFASTSQRGSIQLATSAQTLAGVNSQSAITPAMLRAALVDRHERSGITIASLGAGRYPGETALLTSSDMRVLVYWNGLAWRTASMLLSGTASQRDAIEAQGLVIDGMEWYDSDGAHPPWRRVGGAWSPAVTRWQGTAAQMNLFGPFAPEGFSWFNTTDNSDYVRIGGAWVGEKIVSFAVSLVPSGGSSAGGVFYSNSMTIPFPNPRVGVTPSASVLWKASGVVWWAMTNSGGVTDTSITGVACRIGAAPGGGQLDVTLQYPQGT